MGNSAGTVGGVEKSQYVAGYDVGHEVENASVEENAGPEVVLQSQKISFGEQEASRPTKSLGRYEGSTPEGDTVTLDSFIYSYTGSRPEFTMQVSTTKDSNPGFMISGGNDQHLQIPMTVERFEKLFHSNWEGRTEFAGDLNEYEVTVSNTESGRRVHVEAYSTDNGERDGFLKKTVDIDLNSSGNVSAVRYQTRKNASWWAAVLPWSKTINDSSAAMSKTANGLGLRDEAFGDDPPRVVGAAKVQEALTIERRAGTFQKFANA